MSKATDRKWRKQQLKRAIERQQTDQEARERRLRGFRPATKGEMLALINGRPPQ